MEVEMMESTRKHNTTKAGEEWSMQTKKALWKRAKEIKGFDPDVWRRDFCGLVINWFQFGNRNSDNGWEIDHIDPISNGGDDELDNLQALHWHLNEGKGEAVDWVCSGKANLKGG